ALWEKHEVARIIGRINRRMNEAGNAGEGATTTTTTTTTMLIGPGRWGTSTPSLGVPLRFSELNRMAVLVEVSGAEAGMSPDLSFGTHYCLDLVGAGFVYVAVSPERGTGRWNAGWFAGLKRDEAALAGESGAAADAVHVYDVRERDVRLVTDLVR